MSEISVELVKKMREMTGSPIMECKKALQKTGGKIDEAIKALRTQGLASARLKESRETKEGLISAYIHLDGKLGVLLEINCESDFVAKTPDFRQLGHDIAMQIAASSPIYVSREQVPSEKIEEEKEIYIEQARLAGKPEHILEKIAVGRLEKYFKDVCLLEQPFIREPKTSVKEHIAGVIAKLGENITIRRFVRFKVGESLG
ncbi:MAG: translation elongation factor Ts [bacterium]|nr:translation elongation factor Ts [bacterium]